MSSSGKKSHIYIGYADLVLYIQMLKFPADNKTEVDGDFFQA
jgi:hypothetical protein